jgi:hypothetical protein
VAQPQAPSPENRTPGTSTDGTRNPRRIFALINPGEDSIQGIPSPREESDLVTVSRRPWVISRDRYMEIERDDCGDGRHPALAPDTRTSVVVQHNSDPSAPSVGIGLKAFGRLSARRRQRSLIASAAVVSSSAGSRLAEAGSQVRVLLEGRAVCR